ncbi:protein of unknown function [Daejeonella rubra]|uniref:3-keto-alpha-glucoside-1,2-lyase/3-keto-2-hydroxy-glucal hydratase domain-containing protein n=1 Tax=Daejeonella rubra TaxID=990371 RepID=A0A1G9QEU5_9SPHI|nr:DUF1080 domain-containing protein [Daejeonella rubra]SDM09624.1 protein of unknown function [Daejeonella rubra]
MLRLKITSLNFVAATGIIWLCSTGLSLCQQVQSNTPLTDLSSFKSSGKTWQIVGDVTVNLNKPNMLNTSKGTGILINLSDEKNHGSDLFTNTEHGDMDLELDYMMAKGGNSGIYLQGRYELQLQDTWGAKTPTSGNNGGIYERWDDNRHEGYGGYAPRQNASRAPGLWQHLKISFQAPRFDAGGKKVENARMLRVELNGVIIHDNIELSGPTRGAMSNDEKATGPLRFQGDHGAVAFRNIKITRFDTPRPAESVANNPNVVDPILIDAPVNTILRSFVDLPDGPRVVHAVSVGSPEQVHYTYDMDNAMIIQLWRGGFLNATPMWHSRGDGSSLPLGTVQRFGKPVLALARLGSPQAAWLSDTAGTSYRPKGYVIDDQGSPAFRYLSYGSLVSDFTKAMENGRGISRKISVANPTKDLYFRLAEAASIEEISNGMYLIDDKSYYLRLENTGGSKPILRDLNGRKELIIPVGASLSYSILF